LGVSRFHTLSIGIVERQLLDVPIDFGTCVLSTRIQVLFGHASLVSIEDVVMVFPEHRFGGTLRVAGVRVEKLVDVDVDVDGNARCFVGGRRKGCCGKQDGCGREKGGSSEEIGRHPKHGERTACVEWW